MDDFEYQLAQEAAENAKRTIQTDNNDKPIDNDKPKTYKDPNDGTIYEWDNERRLYYPKIDDDFIAKYQYNYGYNNDTDHHEDDPKDNPKDDDKETDEKFDDKSVPLSKNDAETINEQNSSVNPLLGKRAVQTPQWFDVDDDHNTNVYVSHLPLDTTDEEYFDLMKKCGMIMKDDLNEYKIKLYRDSHGNLKGDGRCCYIKVESVDLALNILDDYNFKGNIIKVERAKFSLKGEFDPKKKPKRKKRDKEKMKKKIEKLFDWRPEKILGERPNHEKTVIIKNMFDSHEFENEPKLILEYRNDVRDECLEKCGDVKKVEIYDRHADGVAAVTFKEFQPADECVKLMNGRFFAGRKLIAHHWDGHTKYKIEETEEEAEKRIQQWEKFLEND